MKRTGPCGEHTNVDRRMCMYFRGGIIPAWYWAAFFVCIFSYLFSWVQCFPVPIPPTVRSVLLRQMDTGSLTCAHIWVSAVHTKGGGHDKKKCAPELTRRDRKQLSFTLLRQGIEPRDFGLEVRRSTTELRPPNEFHATPPLHTHRHDLANTGLVALEHRNETVKTIATILLAPHYNKAPYQNPNTHARNPKSYNIKQIYTL